MAEAYYWRKEPAFSGAGCAPKGCALLDPARLSSAMHPLSPRGVRSGPPHSGFTLVEIMVALVVLGLGITLLAGVTARSARLIHRGRKDFAAAAALTDRLERLRASVLVAGCGPPVAGTAALPGGRREVWAVAPRGGAALLVDSIIPAEVDSGAAAVLGTTVPCR